MSTELKSEKFCLLFWRTSGQEWFSCLGWTVLLLLNAIRTILFISTKLTASIQCDGRVHKNCLSFQQLFACFQNKNLPHNGVQSVQQIVTTFAAYRSYPFDRTFVWNQHSAHWKLGSNLTNATEPQPSKDCGVRPYVTPTLTLASLQIYHTVYFCVAIGFLW